jgi:hypothetical protein
MGTGTLSFEVNQPGLELGNSPPSNAKVKNGGNIPPLSHTSSWRSALLIKHDDNFALFCITFLPKLR